MEKTITEVYRAGKRPEDVARIPPVIMMGLALMSEFMGEHEALHMDDEGNPEDMMKEIFATVKTDMTLTVITKAFTPEQITPGFRGQLWRVFLRWGVFTVNGKARKWAFLEQNDPAVPYIPGVLFVATTDVAAWMEAYPDLPLL